jgi:hypothetical protein
VISIGSYAFNGCEALTSIAIPDSVESIGTYAFQNCKTLGSVIISNAVTTIDAQVFRGCAVLTSVTIPASVTSIGTRAFNECTLLAELTFKGSTVPTFSGAAVFAATSATGTVYYPEGSADSYASSKFTAAGLNASWTFEVDASKADEPLVVDPTTLALIVGQNDTASVSNDLGRTISVQSNDTEVATATYLTGVLTVVAVGPGTATITINAEENATTNASSRAVEVTVSAATGGTDDPDDPDNSDDPDDPVDPVVTPIVQAGDTGVKISGTLKGANIPANATAVVSIKAVTSGDAYDKHLAAKGDGDILVIYEIVLTVNGEEVHGGFGNLTLTFPVGADYEADTVLVRHLHQSGAFTEHSIKVVNGMVSLEVSDLSTFGVEAQSVTKPAADTGTTTQTPTTTTDPAKTGTATAPPKTGDEALPVMLALVAVSVAAAVVLRVSCRRKSDERAGRHWRNSAR